jgi:dihydroxyacid dehydratase/phosphogluconate dehydratase
MQEMLALTGALQGRGMGNDVAFITDGRFSGATHGICAPGVRSMYPRSLHLP